MLGALRQSLITDLGFQALGPGYASAESGYYIALAAFQEGLFACHWESGILTIHAFFAKAITLSAVKDLVAAKLPWSGVRTVLEDDMGSA